MPKLSVSRAAPLVRPACTISDPITSFLLWTTDESAEGLNKLGPGSCYAIPADLSKSQDIDRLVEELSKKEQSKP